MTGLTKPTLILDKTICLRNIERMAHKASEFNLEFRPHFKTHQSAIIGGWFRDFAVEAITVSSVTMAEYFAQNGWDDITIAIPVNIREIGQIDRLASKNKINILVENLEGIEALNHLGTNQLGVFIKIDTGYHRTGVSPSETDFIDTLLERLKENKNLHFKGFLSHTGHTYKARSIDEIREIHTNGLNKMVKLKKWYQRQFPDLILSMGDTPSCSISDNFEGIDEIRPGNFVFYDLMQNNLGVCSTEDIAVRLICPILSVHPSRSEVVMYGGAVHLSKDFILNDKGQAVFGRIIADPLGKNILLDEKNFVCKLSQEHGILKIAPEYLPLFKPGDLVGIIPVHSCLTANLMRGYLTTDGEWIGMMDF